MAMIEVGGRGIFVHRVAFGVAAVCSVYDITPYSCRYLVGVVPELFLFSGGVAYVPSYR